MSALTETDVSAAITRSRVSLFGWRCLVIGFQILRLERPRPSPNDRSVSLIFMAFSFFRVLRCQQLAFRKLPVRNTTSKWKVYELILKLSLPDA